MLSEQYSLDELEIIAADLGAVWDDLRGETISIKALSLVGWAERHALLYELMQAAIRRGGKDVDWDSF